MIPTTAASRVVYALRSLRRAPTYTAISVASLALGIAGAVVALGVVVSVLFRELPYRDPEGLVSVMETTDRRCAGCGDLASREIWGYWRDNTGSVFSALGRHRSPGSGAAMLLERRGIPFVSELLEEPRRALDVGEQERHRSSGEGARHARMIPPRDVGSRDMSRMESGG